MVFHPPFYSVRGGKGQYFQFRLLHHILGTNHFLFKMKLLDNPGCSFCERYDKTILHLFWKCSVVSTFILDVAHTIFASQFKFSKDILFGYNMSLLKHPYNFFIFHLKYFTFSTNFIRNYRNFDTCWLSLIHSTHILLWTLIEVTTNLECCSWDVSSFCIYWSFWQINWSYCLRKWIKRKKYLWQTPKSCANWPRLSL